MRLNYSLVQLILVSMFTISVSACGANGAQNINADNKQIAQAEISSENTMSVARQEINNNKKTANMMTMKGQIVYQTMEGGFYSFIANDGSKYTPMQLPKTHQRHGLIVEIQAQELFDVMTTMQFGKVIKILKVSVLDDSKVTEIKANK